MAADISAEIAAELRAGADRVALRCMGKETDRALISIPRDAGDIDAIMSSAANLIERQAAEIGRLRQIVSECGAAIGNGTVCAPAASLDFMAHIPAEIALVLQHRDNEIAELRRFVPVISAEIERLRAGAWRPTHRHVKRGSEYMIVGTAELQMSFDDLVDGSEMIVYRGQDGRLWCRQIDEFNDGRFARVPPSTSGGEG